MSFNDRPVYFFYRVIFWYRIPVLEKLNERLDGRLVVCSGNPPGASSLGNLVRESDPAYKQVYLWNHWLFGEKVHAQPFRRVFNLYGPPAAILAEESPRSVTLPFLLRYAKSVGAGRVLWGHFSSNYRVFNPRRHILDRYRLALAKEVEGCVCYTEGRANLLRPFVPDRNIFVARNTMDLRPMFAQRTTLATEGKQAVRRRLSISPHSPVLVYIGRLIRGKGTDMLLETWEILTKDTPGTLLIIGDGPERATMEKTVAARSLQGVRFLGSLLLEEAAPWLYASDVMLMPGYLGLAVNHAFAFGVPVVSLHHPESAGGVKFHSPEVEYVRSGKTGLLCSGHTSEALAASVREVLADQDRYSSNALAYARKHLTIDRMVDGLEAAVRHAEEISAVNRV
ncbi:MAG: glycosyltransferase family 4 protein [Bacteroidetes bacterium SB0662_bin_6]|nr:glycosyltransferase family 4 protein [Bacteroidetes bacterium SB0668_bin_1]MYE04224.1 glycosyltransferase family 4 protein [Bacteroidetes bacterium SB0662_bin_6]